MSSLFANTQSNTGSSLFGNAASQPANTGTSLFGTQPSQPTQPANTGSSLLGNAAATTTTAPAGMSLFGNTTSGSTGGLFGGPNAQQQPAPTQQSFAGYNPALNASTAFTTGLANTLPNSALSAAAQQDLARSRLQQFGVSHQSNEKTVWEQAQTLCRKWDPQSQDTLMQGYLYNAVNPAFAPFYHRNADENEREWEAALAAKPQPSKDEEGQVSFVPVLVRGFKALGDRVEYQVKTVNEMRLRLHEMNNSLNAVMATHQQRISVSLETSRRQHVALSQRCLRLAVKVQILKNRGYALDTAEERLRKSLIELETKVLDPCFPGREEEIWARMVRLRERARWLEEEMRRVEAAQMEQHRQQGLGPAEQEAREVGGVTEEVLQKTQRILRDYDGQLKQLETELESVSKEFEEWEQGQHGKQ